MKEISLVLGGGGARGLAHIGVIKYLIEKNYIIKHITGTSMGAIIGGLFAAGMHIKDIEKVAIEFNMNHMRKLFFPTLPKNGFVDGNNISHFLESLIGNPHFEDMDIPFGCVSTDIVKAEEVKHTDGDVVDAIRCSASIPVVFTPYVIEDKVLVDGGLVNPIPVNLCRELGAQTILAVNVLSVDEEYTKSFSIKTDKKREKRIAKFDDFQKKVEEKLSIITPFKFNFNISHFIPTMKKHEPNIMDISVRSLFIMENRIAEYRISIDKPDYVLRPPVGHYNTFDFLKSREIIEIGYNTAKSVLEKEV